MKLYADSSTRFARQLVAEVIRALAAVEMKTVGLQQRPVQHV